MAPSADDPDDRLIVRDEAARMLGVSASTLRRLEARGELLPTRVEDGVHWHSERRVLAYKAAHLHPRTESAADVDGELAAAAFTLFDEGATAAEIVKKLRVPPRVARDLQVEYADLTGQIVVGGLDAVKVREIVQLKDEDNLVRDGADLVAFIEHVRIHRCVGCGWRISKVCLRCYQYRSSDTDAAVSRALTEAQRTRQADEERRAKREAFRQATRETAQEPPDAGSTSLREMKR